MPCLARTEFAHMPHHITQRGPTTDVGFNRGLLAIVRSQVLGYPTLHTEFCQTMDDIIGSVATALLVAHAISLTSGRLKPSVTMVPAMRTDCIKSLPSSPPRVLQPRNRSWITKVRASSWCT